MNWYLAKIVFRIICGEGRHTAQFDEQLRLISATDEEQAFLKARALGEQEQEVFPDKLAKLVEWKFIDVSELYKISELVDGAELYSKVQETEDAELFTSLVQKKALSLKQNSVHKYLQLL